MFIKSVVFHVKMSAWVSLTKTVDECFDLLNLYDAVTVNLDLGGRRSVSVFSGMDRQTIERRILGRAPGDMSVASDAEKALFLKLLAHVDDLAMSPESYLLTPQPRPETSRPGSEAERPT